MLVTNLQALADDIDITALSLVRAGEASARITITQEPPPLSPTTSPQQSKYAIARRLSQLDVTEAIAHSSAAHVRLAD
jgi:hypothetical protein